MKINKIQHITNRRHDIIYMKKIKKGGLYENFKKIDTYTWEKQKLKLNDKNTMNRKFPYILELWYSVCIELCRCVCVCVCTFVQRYMPNKDTLLYFLSLHTYTQRNAKGYLNSLWINRLEAKYTEYQSKHCELAPISLEVNP